jgi:hypothetical protein
MHPQKLVYRRKMPFSTGPLLINSIDGKLDRRREAVLFLLKNEDLSSGKPDSEGKTIKI